MLENLDFHGMEISASVLIFQSFTYGTKKLSALTFF